MATVIKRGKGIRVRCSGDERMIDAKNTGGCGAILSLAPSDIFNISSMVPGGKVSQAFRCPQCGEVSDLNSNRVKK